MDVAIRVDASLLIGTGHVMRCLTLASMCHRAGHNVIFISRQLPGNLNDQVQKRGYICIALPFNDDEAYLKQMGTDDYASWLGVDIKKDAIETKSVLSGYNIDLLVVDHYGLDIRWEKQLRQLVQQIMVIDDLANRQHDCDFILDHNYYHDFESRYDDLVPANCKKLLGPQHALISPKLKDVKQQRQRLGKTLQPEKVERIVVFLGGIDPKNYTQAALNQLLEHSGYRQANIDVVLGPGNPNKQALKCAYSSYDNIVFHVSPSNYFELLAHADLAVGAGGVAQLERMYIDLPSIVMSVADNQAEIVRDALDVKGVLSFNVKNQSMGQSVNVEFELFDCDNLWHEAEITIVTPVDGWFHQYAVKLKKGLSKKYAVRLIGHHSDVKKTKICFYLSYPKIVPSSVLALSKSNVVVHASDLPKGKGWSPWVWEVIDGAENLTLTLFEMSKGLDDGPYYFKHKVYLNGTELLGEMRELLGNEIVSMCYEYATKRSFYKQKEQVGVESFYPRRRPQDSKLDPSLSIKDQMNLLRVVDNDNYPATFDYLGETFIIKIYKQKDKNV